MAPKFLDTLFGIDRKRVGPTQTAGGSGTAVWGGYVQHNELNSKLTGREKYKTYSDILANTSIVAAGTRYFLQMVSKAGWKLEAPQGGGAEADKIAELLSVMLHDMETPWPRVVRRAALYRFYGFSVQEWTAKRREDGVIAMRDVAPRPQITIERWDPDVNGKIQGVTQRIPQTMQEVYLPRTKLIYIVDDCLTDSPEGLGLFRHVVDAANRLRRFEQLEGFGFETDLRGIPIGRGPFALLQQMVSDSTITAEQKAQIEQPLKDFIEGHIKTPALGLILDSNTYRNLDEAASPSSVKQWDMEIMQGGATGQTEVSSAIERINREIARVLGTEHLLLGEGTASMALSRDKSNNFATLVDSTLEDLTTAFSQDFLNPIFELNGWDKKLKPKMKTEATQYRDIEQITGALQQMAQAGAMLAPDDPAINEVRDMMGISRQDDALVRRMLADEQAAAKAKLKPPAAPPQVGVNPQ